MQHLDTVGVLLHILNRIVLSHDGPIDIHLEEYERRGGTGEEEDRISSDDAPFSALAAFSSLLAARMYTAGQKDPDLILRPSGEKRLSNFMLWQAAYAELVEMDVLWPDFTPADLDAAIAEYNRRSRRFGGI